MFDIVRRRSYDERRILIDSARILDSPFDASPVFMTGAELELLRNLTQYLHRQDTFVATYYSNHYLTPDVDAWDAIQAIVAGLEEKLMGIDNVIFGYEDVLGERESEDSDVDATFQVDGALVPAGEVWRVLGVACSRSSEAPDRIIVSAYIDAIHVRLGDVSIEYNIRFYPKIVDILLHEGDKLSLDFTDSIIGETCTFCYWGYKMGVP